MSSTTDGPHPGSDLTVEPREGYLYLHLAPGFELTPESTTRLWTTVGEACRQHNLRHVLADGENVQRKLTPVQTYDHTSLAARLIPGLALACCFRGYQTDEQTEFMKVAAMNRGAQVEFFEDLNAALHWLGART